MGVVYKALDQGANSSIPVALKLINARNISGESAMKRLIDEGLLTRDIRHPNIIAVYDVAISDGQPYVSMEYLQGDSLRTWISRRTLSDENPPVPVRVAARIIMEILEGLRAAHAKGVIHRDLKPENILLTDDPTKDAAPLKILDFGIARAAGGVLKTGSGTGLGTPEYMAPEQRTNPDAVNASSDLYSVAIMFYELLVGVVPGRHWQPPSGGRSDVPQGIDTLINLGMSDNRTQRPKSADEFKSMLVNAMNGLPIIKRDNETTGELVKRKITDHIEKKLDETRKRKTPAWVWWMGGLIGLAMVAVGVDEATQQDSYPYGQGSDW